MKKKINNNYYKSNKSNSCKDLIVKRMNCFKEVSLGIKN